jgi:hypothetical protein
MRFLSFFAFKKLYYLVFLFVFIQKNNYFRTCANKFTQSVHTGGEDEVESGSTPLASSVVALAFTLTAAAKEEGGSGRGLHCPLHPVPGVGGEQLK